MDDPQGSGSRGVGDACQPTRLISPTAYRKARALIRARLPGRARRGQRARLDLLIRTLWEWQENGALLGLTADVELAQVIADVEHTLKGA